jgi:D-alanyl-D-alanine carboxypeptidase (penicillin-binding protein 5/6)
VKVWKGIKDEVSLSPVEAPNFLIAQSQKKLLKWEIKKPEEITAPVQEKQPIGEVVFSVSDQPKRTVVLASNESVAEAGWFKRMWQTLFHIHKVDWRWLLGITGGIVILAAVVIFLLNRRPSFPRHR